MKSRTMILLLLFFVFSPLIFSCDGEVNKVVKFIEKYKNGTTWGSTADEVAYWVAFDSAKNSYVVGHFMGGPTDFDPDPTIDDIHSSNGDRDCYLAKYDSDQKFLWAKTWGGTGEDIATVVNLDSNGNVYVGGFFENNVDFDPDPVDATTKVSNGDLDAFLTKFDGNGDFQWVKNWGGSDEEEINTIAIDSNDNIYLGGTFEDTVDFNPDPATTDNHTAVDRSDAYFMKFNTSGDVAWARTWGNAESDSVESLAIDSKGNILVAGYFSYSKRPPAVNPTVDFDPDPVDEANVTTNGLGDAYFSKFDPTGDFLWVKTFGGVEDDNCQSIAFDNSGNIVVVGRWGTKFSAPGYVVDFDPDPVDTQNETSSGGRDIFIAKFDSNADFLWVQTTGGDDNENVKDVAIDKYNNIYVCGYFFNTADFDPDFNVLDERTSLGEDDCFLCCYTKDGNYRWTKTWGCVYRDDANCVKIMNKKVLFVLGNVGFTSIPGVPVDLNPDPNVDDIRTMNGEGDSYFLVFEQ